MAGNINSGRKPNSTDEETLAGQMAERKAANLKRKAAEKSQRQREKITKQYDEGSRQRGKPVHPAATEESVKAHREKQAAKKDSAQLMIAFRQLVSRLIDETKKQNIVDVDCFDKESIERRKQQMGNIKDLIFVIKNIRDIVDIVMADETSTGTDTTVYSSEKVALLEDARNALKQIGLNKSGL